MEGYKHLITYQLSLIIFDLTWDFTPQYYSKYEDSRQRDQLKQAARSTKQNIVEGSSERSLSSKLKLYDVAKASSRELLEDFEDILGRIDIVIYYLVDLLYRLGYLLDKQIQAVEEKHRTEGGYRVIFIQPPSLREFYFAEPAR